MAYRQSDFTGGENRRLLPEFIGPNQLVLAQNCESFDQLQQRFYRQINFDTFYH